MAEIAQAFQTIENVKTDLSQAISREGHSRRHLITDAGKRLFIS